ncbi:MAG: hypothetical protein HGA80_09150, partial [Candidatus Omnitrophica bacterium]|nr:hypothetical protein [Candidatus Omnitrophota bacterium]
MRTVIMNVIKKPVFWVGIAFVFWVYCFRGYLFGKLGFTSDATSYYEHIRFFLTNLMSGHFSLWDPYWSGGVPNDFFLRRFCPYNPFYLLIVLFSLAGIPYYFSYVVFLVCYMFFGMFGFYLITRKLTGDDISALVAFLLLLFSAVSTRIFDSYMIFVLTPLLWFFYYLVSFASDPQRKNVLGLAFFAMITLTTYIPLYFIVIVLSFLVVFAVLYFDRIAAISTGLFNFIKRERWLSIFCAVAVLAAVLPGVMFFQEAGKGSIAIPGRHYNTSESNVLAVQDQSEDSWAVPEEFFFSAYYHDLKRITFAIVYMPCFLFIPLVLGFGLRISRLTVLLAVWGGLLLLVTAPFGSSLYSFLRDKVFIFKYFRNLHFLLWFALLPLLALFVG